jgi:hypothetical protein
MERVRRDRMVKCVSDLGDEDMRVDKETKQVEAAARGPGRARPPRRVAALVNPSPRHR